MICDHWEGLSPRGIHDPMAAELAPWDAHALGIRDWESPKAEVDASLEPYRREDSLLDHLASWPTDEQIQKLVSLMRPSEVREYAHGVTRDMVVACKSLDPLEMAENINGWIATMEEVVAHRRKLRFIRAARPK